jgi:hypothetical protein
MEENPDQATRLRCGRQKKDMARLVFSSRREAHL